MHIQLLLLVIVLLLLLKHAWTVNLETDYINNFELTIVWWQTLLWNVTQRMTRSLTMWAAWNSYSCISVCLLSDLMLKSYRGDNLSKPIFLLLFSVKSHWLMFHWEQRGGGWRWQLWALTVFLLLRWQLWALTVFLLLRWQLWVLTVFWVLLVVKSDWWKWMLHRGSCEGWWWWQLWTLILW